jgi:pimeloyl-ACP methyl ester carboxylesterase
VLEYDSLGGRKASKEAGRVSARRRAAILRRSANPMTASSATGPFCRAVGRVPALALVIAVLAPAATSLHADSSREPATAPIIVLIGGNHSDPSPEQLAGKAGRSGNSGLYRLKQDLRDQDGLQAEYFNWNGTRGGRIDDAQPEGAVRIARRIRQLRAVRPQAPVILVGNSWGGHTAWQVCHLLAGGTIDERLGTQQSINGGVPQAPRPTASAESTTAGDDPESEFADPSPLADGIIAVELLVLLDPSSFGRGTQPMPKVLPANVHRAANFHTSNSFGWCGWLEDERLENIDLGDPQHGYLAAGGPRYDSPLNWAAHVAAEWDERIHVAIRQRIANVVAP